MTERKRVYFKHTVTERKRQGSRDAKALGPGSGQRPLHSARPRHARRLQRAGASPGSPPHTCLAAGSGGGQEPTKIRSRRITHTVPNTWGLGNRAQIDFADASRCFQSRGHLALLRHSQNLWVPVVWPPPSPATHNRDKSCAGRGAQPPSPRGPPGCLAIRHGWACTWEAGTRSCCLVCVLSSHS